jgi:hypothetical protein
MERWIRTCRTERLDRTLIWNQPTYDTPYASTSRTTTNTGPTAHSTLRHYSARYRNKPGL